MRKLMCLVITLLLCCSLVMPAFAAQSDEFVPSITYKDGPDIIEAIQKSDKEEKDVDDCIVVTTLKQAEENSGNCRQLLIYFAVSVVL